MPGTPVGLLQVPPGASTSFPPCTPSMILSLCLPPDVQEADLYNARVAAAALVADRAAAVPADRARLEEACFAVALDPDVLNRPWSELSGGERQRAALVVATNLCPRPSVLLLDEPTSALDPEMISEVLETMVSLAEDGMSMICVTHELGFAREVAHRIIFMDEGALVEDRDPVGFFERPDNPRTQKFLSKILR